MGSNQRKEEKYYVLLGIKDNAIVMLDYVFEYSDNFKGACGTEFELHSYEYATGEWNSLEYAKEYCRDNGIWVEAIKAGKTEESLETFAQEVLDEQEDWGYDYLGQDNSYREELFEGLEALSAKDKRAVMKILQESDCYDFEHDSPKFEGIVVMNCIGGGRCFNYGDKEKFDYVFENTDKYFELIDQYEKREEVKSDT